MARVARTSTTSVAIATATSRPRRWAWVGVSARATLPISPSTRQSCPAPRTFSAVLVREAQQQLDVIVGDADRRLRLDQERRCRAPLRPGKAGLVQVVVDPGGRPVAGVLVDRVDLPVS